MSRGSVHLAVSVVNDLTATVTQYADSTALCVFKCSILALLCAAG